MPRRLFLFAIFAFLATHAQAEEIKPESRITAVTVYTGRATVTRQMEVDLPAGASTLVLENLPASVLTDSLRTEGSGTAKVTLGAIESKRINGSEFSAPREREITDKLQALQDQRALVVADGEAIDARKNFITNLGQQAGLRENENIAEIKLAPEQWMAAGSAIYTGLSDTLKAAAAQNVALRKLDDQIQALQAELNTVRTGQKAALRVAVPLEAQAPTKLKLKITYQLPAATWRPIYDARLDTMTGKLALSQFGEVRQSTGEDWSDVALTLSTAQPMRGTVLPTLSTAWVDILPPPPAPGSPKPVARNKAGDGESSAGPMARMAPVMGAMQAPMVAMMAQDGVAAAAPEPPPVEAEFNAASIHTGGYVSEYAIPGTATVTADNTARKIMIGPVETSATLLADVRPSLSPHAFLVARTKILGESPVLPGQASLFRDGAYSGTAQLPLMQPGEETPLSFGIDDQILVKRQVLADSKGSSGILAKDNTLERKVVTELQNLHRFAVKLEVREAIPVARNDQIKVEVLSEDTTPEYSKDADAITGVLKWQRAVAAGAKDNVKLGWRLTYPANVLLEGVP